MWYHTTNKLLYVWVDEDDPDTATEETHHWQVVENQAAIDAAAAASAAQDTADGKRRVFVAEPQTPYDVGDLWDRGPTTGLYRCKIARISTEEFSSGDWQVIADKTSLNTAADFTGRGELARLDEISEEELETALLGLIDGKIEQYYQSSDPQSTWTGAPTKRRHLGDLWYDTEENKLYVYREPESGSFEWTYIEDAETTAAAAAASAAQDTADGKRRVFVAQPTTPYDEGDLWDKGNGVNEGLWRCVNSRASGSYVATDWRVAADTTSANTAAGFQGQGSLSLLSTVSYNVLDTSLQGLLDGKIEQHYQTGDPSDEWPSNPVKREHIGDLWYHPNNKVLKVWDETSTNTFEWREVQNQDALDAAEAASTAQDTADGKRRVFVDTPAPPYDVGDLWDKGNGENEGLWRCITAKAENQQYAAGDWQVAADTTSNNTAASFAGQGALATLSSVSFTNLDQALRGRIDGKIEQFYSTSDPSTSWDADEKEEHLGDLWYNPNNRTLKVWREVSGTYQWDEIENQAAIDAAAAASAAQGTADGKIQLFVTQTPVPPYDVGDLWDRGSTNGLWRCITARSSTQSYAESHWQRAADTTANNTAAAIANQGGFATLDEINSSNVSTYIANAAITDAQINDLSADTITTGTLDATDVSIINLTVSNLAGDVTEIDTFTATNVPFQVQASYIRDMVTIPAQTNSYRPFVTINATAQLQDNITVWGELQMRENNTTSKTSIGTATSSEAANYEDYFYLDGSITFSSTSTVAVGDLIGRSTLTNPAYRVVSIITYSGAIVAFVRTITNGIVTSAPPTGAYSKFPQTATWVTVSKSYVVERSGPSWKPMFFQGALPDATNNEVEVRVVFYRSGTVTNSTATPPTFTSGSKKFGIINIQGVVMQAR